MLEKKYPANFVLPAHLNLFMEVGYLVNLSTNPLFYISTLYMRQFGHLANREVDQEIDVRKKSSRIILCMICMIKEQTGALLIPELRHVSMDFKDTPAFFREQLYVFHGKSHPVERSSKPLLSIFGSNAKRRITEIIQSVSVIWYWKREDKPSWWACLLPEMINGVLFGSTVVYIIDVHVCTLVTWKRSLQKYRFEMHLIDWCQEHFAGTTLR